MNTHADKTSENRSQAVANNLPKLQSNGEPTFQFVDNRQAAIAHRKLQEAINNSPRVQQLRSYQETANNSPQVKQLRAYQAMADNFTSQIAQRKENLEEETLQRKFEPIQKKENNTGLPDNLKSGIENLSGYSMDDVKVHYNSDQPTQFQAHAYAQGTDIHLASGQEKHLAHEAWHVVQQKQGRVKTTMQMKDKVNINDDASLENEADVVGAKALNSVPMSNTLLSNHKTTNNVKQFVVYQNEAALWQAVAPDTSITEIRKTIDGNSELKKAFEDSLLNLNRMNFVNSPGTQPEASIEMNLDNTYDITYGLRTTQNVTFKDEEIFIGAIIHEMGHVNSGLQYITNVPQGSVYHVANMHLPVATAPYFYGTPVGENQRNDPATGWEVQRVNMEQNWDQIQNLRDNDHGFTTEESEYLNNRVNYAKGSTPEAHYDTVLVDILYYLQHHGLTETHFYLQATAMLQEANTRRRAGNGTVPLIGLVPQPNNTFLQLYNGVSTILNDPLWASEGEGFIGKKTPDGITKMKEELDSANKRNSLNAIQKIASAKMGKKDKDRSESTSDIYDVLSKVNRRSNFGELITRINVCKLWLGRNRNEPIELT